MRLAHSAGQLGRCRFALTEAERGLLRVWLSSIPILNGNLVHSNLKCSFRILFLLLLFLSSWNGTFLLQDFSLLPSLFPGTGREM